MPPVRFIDISTKRVGDSRIAAIIGYEGEDEPRIFLPHYTKANSFWRFIINHRFRIVDKYTAELDGDYVTFTRYEPGPVTLRNFGVKLTPEALSAIADMVTDRELFIVATEDIRSQKGGLKIRKGELLTGYTFVTLFAFTPHWHVSDKLLVLLDEDEYKEYLDATTPA